jgi:hypothetical protein
VSNQGGGGTSSSVPIVNTNAPPPNHLQMVVSNFNFRVAGGARDQFNKVYIRN